MTATVTTTEIANRPGAVWQRVIAGEEIVVTAHGRAIVRLVPVGANHENAVRTPESEGPDAGTSGGPSQDVPVRGREGRGGREVAAKGKTSRVGKTVRRSNQNIQG